MIKRRSTGEGNLYHRPDGLCMALITLPDDKRRTKYSKIQMVVKGWLLEQRKS